MGSRHDPPSQQRPGAPQRVRRRPPPLRSGLAEWVTALTVAGWPAGVAGRRILCCPARHSEDESRQKQCREWVVTGLLWCSFTAAGGALGNHARVTPTHHFPPPRVVGGGERGDGAGAAAAGVSAAGATHSPTVPPQALPGEGGPGTERARQRVPRVLDSAKALSLSTGTQIPLRFPLAPSSLPEIGAQIIWVACHRDHQFVWRRGSGYQNPLLSRASPGLQRQRRQAQLLCALRDDNLGYRFSRA